ncbi:MAG: phosphotransferase family protein [Nitriliruptor sp.]|uniref:phosphotransferase family protein n=1 Tax=Nitriliruptor sp. TaxID=2448056 RepID=UPI00349FEBA6
MSDELVDRHLAEVRDADAFDVAAVHAWLRDEVAGLPDDPPEVRQFTGGASNLTYLLRYPDRELILRRPPVGAKPASGHDVLREARIQELLQPAFPYVPAVVATAEAHPVLGSDVAVTERLHGTILRSRIPSALDLDAAAARHLSEQLVDRWVELHDVDPLATGLASFGRGPGYVERQITGWSQRYRAARTRNVPSFERVMAWLEAHRPDDVGSCVVHGDWRFDNLVLAPDDPSRIVGVLDWELATVGDPLMDLGASLAYWVQADDGRAFRMLRRQPTDAPGMLTRDEVVARYLAATGRSVAPDGWRFYEVYGLFRLAVIIEQIHARDVVSASRNPAFRWFWLGVHVLHRRCLRLIRQAGR